VAISDIDARLTLLPVHGISGKGPEKEGNGYDEGMKRKMM